MFWFLCLYLLCVYYRFLFCTYCAYYIKHLIVIAIYFMLILTLNAHKSFTFLPSPPYFMAVGQEIKIPSIWNDVKNPSQTKCGALPVGKCRKPVVLRSGNHGKQRKPLRHFLSVCWRPSRLALLSRTPRQPPPSSRYSYREKTCNLVAPQSWFCN